MLAPVSSPAATTLSGCSITPKSAPALPALPSWPIRSRDASAEQAELPRDGFGGAIISLGPHTDAVLDHFNLSDTLLPRLRVLTTTVRSSKWEATLRGDQWGLGYDQAINLSNAMLADIKNQPMPQLQVPILYISDPKLLTSSHSNPKASCCPFLSFSSTLRSWPPWWLCLYFKMGYVSLFLA